MSRALTLGNSRMLIGFDRFGRVRDFYYPYVGLENHVGGHHVHHVGVWVDGVLKWFGDTSWDIEVASEPEALTSRITARCASLGVSLVFTDVVYNEKNIFVRRVVVKNEADRRRDIRVYLGHQFEMYESHAAHTAYFDPHNNVLVHYRGRRFFLVNGRIDEEVFQDYTTGVFGIEGREGSHRDAEDGRLSQNPIEHGPADSVLGFTGVYGAGEEKQIDYWLCVGRTLGEVQSLDDYVRDHGCGHIVRTTTDFWRAWVNRQRFSFYGLSDNVVDLFKKSLLLIRIHADETTGSILASADSGILQAGKDTYAYMWPRDGALASVALYRSGSYATSQRFFKFCNSVISPDGYLMHKFGADKTLGSSWHPWVRDGKPTLPIQEDETALVLFALWEYYQLSKNLDFIESIYNSFIKKSADFLVAFRDETTGLSKPSYDLWEEKYGIHTFTVAATAAALEAAGEFARLLGKREAAGRYASVADSMRRAIIRYLYDEKSGVFYKMLMPAADGSLSPDTTLDMSSVYGIFRFGVLPPDDERVQKAISLIKERIQLTTHTGGVARYENDNYHRVSTDTPGNPWFITTLWLAQYAISIAEDEGDMEEVKEWLEWCTKFAYKSGTLPEQLHPHSGEHISAGPLTWSHAEYVVTVIQYLNRLEALGVCLACNPVG